MMDSFVCGAKVNLCYFSLLAFGFFFLVFVILSFLFYSFFPLYLLSLLFFALFEKIEGFTEFDPTTTSDPLLTILVEIYTCFPRPNVVTITYFAPERGKILSTHFLSINPLRDHDG